LGKAAELRVLRGDVIHGPFNRDQIQDLVVRGRLSGPDLVSVQGGPWVRISEYLEEAPPRQVWVQPAAPAPPVEIAFPEPTSPEVTPATRPAFDWSGTLLWLYRVLLVVAVIGVASPWYTASSEVSAPLLGSGGSRASVAGLSIAWGILSLLLLLGGGVTSFLVKTWKVHCGLAAAAFGLVAVAALQLSSTGVKVQSSFGGATATARTALAWGIWLTLLASGVAAGTAYLAGLSAAAAWLRQRTPNRIAVRNFSILTGCVMVFGLLLVLIWSGALPVGFDSGGPATHAVTDDACLYLYGLGQLDHPKGPSMYLFLQHATGPLAGSPQNKNPHPQESPDAEHAIVLPKGTLVRVVKTEFEKSSTDIYTVHFVTVVSGSYKGKEGWINDRYLRPANS
jgi:hypothetical protein